MLEYGSEAAIVFAIGRTGPLLGERPTHLRFRKRISSAEDDQTNGIGQLLCDIRDHVPTQETSEGSAV